MLDAFDGTYVFIAICDTGLLLPLAFTFLRPSGLYLIWTGAWNSFGDAEMLSYLALRLPFISSSSPWSILVAEARNGAYTITKSSLNEFFTS